MDRKHLLNAYLFKHIAQVVHLFSFLFKSYCFSIWYISLINVCLFETERSCFLQIRSQPMIMLRHINPVAEIDGWDGITITLCSDIHPVESSSTAAASLKTKLNPSYQFNRENIGHPPPARPHCLLQQHSIPITPSTGHE